MFGRRLKKWYPVLLVLLFVAGGVGLLFLLPDEPRVGKPLPHSTAVPKEPEKSNEEDSFDQLPPLLDDEADREIEKDFPDLLELPDPLDIPREQDSE